MSMVKMTMLLFLLSSLLSGLPFGPLSVQADIIKNDRPVQHDDSDAMERALRRIALVPAPTCPCEEKGVMVLIPVDDEIAACARVIASNTPRLPRLKFVSGRFTTDEFTIGTPLGYGKDTFAYIFDTSWRGKVIELSLFRIDSFYGREPDSPFTKPAIALSVSVGFWW